MPSPRITVKALQDADLNLVAKLWFESWRSTGMEAAQRESEADFQRRIRQELDGWNAYVAFSESEPVGFLALVIKEGCLDQLFVAPQSQGQGIGQLLLNIAKEKLPNGFWLRTGVDNRGACAFYDDQGLTRVRTELHPRLNIPMVIYHWSSP
jgi:ribosomal protein S18 acetylase RimI-like enzyme